MIDRTSNFQEIVRKKNNNKQWILQTNKNKSDKHKKDVVLEASFSILNTINTLESFLDEHKENYVNVGIHISSISSKMTDRERDEIDKLATNQMQICKTSIEQLENLVKEHYIEKSQESIEFLQMVIKNPSFLKQNVDLIRDDPNDFVSYPKDILEKFTPRVIFYLNIIDQLKVNLKSISNTFKKLKTFRLNAKIKENEKFTIGSKKENSENSAYPLSSSLSYELNEQSNRLHYDKDIDFGEDEKLIYEKQNQSLINELETVADQVQVINKQLEELSSLFDEITPLIVSHREIIDNIYSTNVDSSNFITRGNNIITDASKETFGFRIMVLLFLIISSFVLLFLNWYKD